MKIINGHSEKIILATSVLISTLCLWLFFAMVIDGEYINRPVIYWEGCFGSVQPVYYPGDEIKLRVFATKMRNIPGTVDWSLINSDTKEQINFQRRQTLLGLGYHDYSVRVGVVPQYIDPGHYRMIGMVTFSVNSVRDLSLNLMSDVLIIQNRYQ
jgi:hypothetical protein